MDPKPHHLDDPAAVLDPAAPHVPTGYALSLGEPPLLLDSGASLPSVVQAFQTYGKLNADRSNAVLVCQPLTCDQYAADPHPITGKPGWWSTVLGPGLPLDTDRYFFICPNVLGGCMGSTGPDSINPESGKPYMLNLPLLTIRDMVRAQARLLDLLGIETLFAAVGGSMGGMQALQWAVTYPERVRAVAVIASSHKHSAQNIAFHEIGRQAVMADPEWCDGNYLLQDRRPTRGLAVARMTAHVTYLSEAALHAKFGRRLQDRPAVTYGFDADFEVESYLRHQGSTFVERFDANSYLYITRAMDYFDLAEAHDGVLANAFRDRPVRYGVFSFSSDWLFPTSESRELVRALNAVAADVSFVEIQSDKGHDAFLLEEPEFFAALDGFIDGSAERFGIATP